MRKTIIIPTTILFFVLVLATFVFAVGQGQQGSLDTDYIQKHRNAKLLNIFQPMKMVGGGLCGDDPSDAGWYSGVGCVLCVENDGTYNDITGCDIACFDTFYKQIGKNIEAKPNQCVQCPKDTTYWERYNCKKVAYTCPDFKSTSCGDGVCADDEMKRVRTCKAEDGRTWDEQRCVIWSECKKEVCADSYSDWSECKLDGKKCRSHTFVNCFSQNECVACDDDGGGFKIGYLFVGLLFGGGLGLIFFRSIQAALISGGVGGLLGLIIGFVI